MKNYFYRRTQEIRMLLHLSKREVTTAKLTKKLSRDMLEKLHAHGEDILYDRIYRSARKWEVLDLLIPLGAIIMAGYYGCQGVIKFFLLWKLPLSWSVVWQGILHLSIIIMMAIGALFCIQQILFVLAVRKYSKSAYFDTNHELIKQLHGC